MSSLSIMKGLVKKNPFKLKGRSTSYSKEEISPLIRPGDEWEIKDEIDIEPPYSSVVIFFNQKTGEYLYHVNEPIIPDNLKNFIKNVKDNIIEDIDSNPDKREERIEILRKKIYPDSRERGYFTTFIEILKVMGLYKSLCLIQMWKIFHVMVLIYQYISFIEG